MRTRAEGRSHGRVSPTVGRASPANWAAIAYLAIGDRLVGHDDGWVNPPLIGAGIDGARSSFALTGIGSIVAFGVGATGSGAVLRDWLGRATVETGSRLARSTVTDRDAERGRAGS